MSRAKADGYITYEEGAYVYGKGIVFIFSATGYRNKDLKDASIYVGSDFYDLFCWVNEEGDKIICNAQGGLTQFAGQIAIIYLGGQIFYVIIPGKAGAPQDSQSLTCPQGQEPGADVTFLTNVPSFVTFFVPGSTGSEVYSNATSYLGGFYVGIDSVGSPYCTEFGD